MGIFKNLAFRMIAAHFNEKEQFLTEQTGHFFLITYILEYPIKNRRECYFKDIVQHNWCEKN